MVFKPLKNSIGIDGKIIGVDLTPKMLEVAKSKCDKKGMKNIDLINTNILSFKSNKANFDINKRDLIVYIKSKYEVTYYKEHLGGGGYTIVFKRQ